MRHKLCGGVLSLGETERLLLGSQDYSEPNTMARVFGARTRLVHMTCAHDMRDEIVLPSIHSDGGTRRAD